MRLLGWPFAGFLPDRRAYVGEPTVAATAFRAVEVFHRDQEIVLIVRSWDQPWLLDVPPERWVATRMVPFELADGRTAWAPGISGWEFADPECRRPRP